MGTFKEVHKMGYCLHSQCKFSTASFVLFQMFPQQHDLPRALQAQPVHAHVLLLNFTLHATAILCSIVLTNNILSTLLLEDGQHTHLKQRQTFEGQTDKSFIAIKLILVRIL